MKSICQFIHFLQFLEPHKNKKGIFYIQKKSNYQKSTRVSSGRRKLIKKKEIIYLNHNFDCYSYFELKSQQYHSENENILQNNHSYGII